MDKVGSILKWVMRFLIDGSNELLIWMNYLAPAGPSLPHLPTYQFSCCQKSLSDNCYRSLSSTAQFPSNNSQAVWLIITGNHCCQHEWHANRQIYFSGRPKQWEKNEIKMIKNCRHSLLCVRLSQNVFFLRKHAF